MKRLMVLVLVSVMLCSLIACGDNPENAAPEISENVNTNVSEDVNTNVPIEEEIEQKMPLNEYERAIWYGFLSEDLADVEPDTTIVTWKQYCNMLGNMIKTYDESKLNEWQQLTANVKDEPILREEAALCLLFAAKTMDVMVYNCDYEQRFDNNNLDNADWNYPISGWDTPVTILDDEDSNHLGISTRFCVRRISCITSEPLLNDINGDGDLHLRDGLTLRDAMISVARLYESDEDVAMNTASKILELVKKIEEAKEIISKVETRKQEILNTKTDIVKSDTYIPGETYTGTAYYVSNSGNDSADGLSPETAWATIERLAEAEFQYGDSIFFERGGLWRKAQMPVSVKRQEGLTLSAYGEGEKPRFYGSPENGSGAEKWELYYEGENGEKIWKYHLNMSDCSAIVFGEKDIVLKDLFYWENGNFYSDTDITQPYVIENELKDMEFFMDMEYNDDPDYGDVPFIKELNKGQFIEYVEGPLYVRCDAGNPGEMYDGIEFLASYHFFDGMADDITIDNLCFRYCTNGISGGFGMGQSSDGITVQNTEVGWVGGKLCGFSRTNKGLFGHVSMDGGGINLNGSNETIRNCYTHHCFQEGVAVEVFAEDSEHSSGNVISDNVIEYCQYCSSSLINWSEDSTHLTDSVCENNYVLYTGFENLYNYEPRVKMSPDGIDWSKAIGAEVRDTSALSVRNLGEGCVISNNVYALSTSQLAIISWSYEKAALTFEGNTYIVLPGFAYAMKEKNDWGPWLQVMETDGDIAIGEWLGDTNATLVPID